MFEDYSDISTLWKLLSHVRYTCTTNRKFLDAHKTIRYKPAHKAYETQDLTWIAGKRYNYKVLFSLQKNIRADEMKAFFSTAEKMLQIHWVTLWWYLLLIRRSSTRIEMLIETSYWGVQFELYGENAQKMGLKRILHFWIDSRPQLRWQ